MVEQIGELLGFQVGQLERVVGGGEFAAVLPRLRASVARKPAGTAFDFDQKKTKDREDEQIDFVHRTGEGDELEKRPGPPGLVRGEAFADEFESVTLPREGGFSERCPI